MRHHFRGNHIDYQDRRVPSLDLRDRPGICAPEVFLFAVKDVVSIATAAIRPSPIAPINSSLDIVGL